MGSFAYLTIGGYPIQSSKNYYHRWYFRKKDRVSRPRPKAGRNTLIWAAAEQNEQHEIETDYRYVTTGAALRRRLELDGFNREVLEREFKERIAERIASIEELSEYDSEQGNDLRMRLPILKSSTLDDWLRVLKIAVDDGVPSWRWGGVKQNYTDLLLHALFGQDEFLDEPSIHDTGFPCKSLESMAIAMLEILPPETECALDVTDLVDGGWTNSFEDLVEFSKDFTTFYEVFSTAIGDTRSLIELAPNNPTLARLLYANAITAMETYLSDTLKKQVLTREPIRRRFVQSNDAFKDKKFTIQEIFSKLDSLNDEVVNAIDKMSFHNLDKTPALFTSVLDTKFPHERMSDLKMAVENRHDIVHRNGKTTQGKSIEVSMVDVMEVIELVESTVMHIDKQIKDGLLDDED